MDTGETVRASLVTRGQIIEQRWHVVGYGPHGIVTAAEDGQEQVFHPQALVHVTPVSVYQQLAMLMENGQKVQAATRVRLSLGTSLRDACKVLDALFPPQENNDAH